MNRLENLYLCFLMDNLAQERLSRLIKKLRGDRSQRSFAKSLGVSYASIRTWEEGESMPGIASLQKIAEYSNQSIEELLQYLSGEEEDKSSKLPFPAVKSADDIIPHLENLSKQEIAKLAQFLIEKLAVN